MDTYDDYILIHHTSRRVLIYLPYIRHLLTELYLLLEHSEISPELQKSQPYLCEDLIVPFILAWLDKILY